MDSDRVSCKRIEKEFVTIVLFLSSRQVTFYTFSFETYHYYLGFSLWFPYVSQTEDAMFLSVSLL